MCTGSKSAPPPKEVEKPVFIRNPYLDEDSSKEGGPGRVSRSSLAIPLETGIGFTGRGGTSSGTDGGNPLGNSKPARTPSAAAVKATPIGIAPIPVGPRAVPQPIPTGPGGRLTKQDVLRHAVLTRNPDGSPKS